MKPRRHKPLSNEKLTHMVMSIPPDEAATIRLILVEKFGFTEVSELRLERGDGSTVTIA